MNILKKSLLLNFLTFILFSCNDIAIMQESDLKKYPWLTAFISASNYSEFEGTHNIDIGTIEFSYKIAGGKSNRVFVQLDSIAKKDNWEILKSTDLNREYSKRVSKDIKDGGNILLKIELDTIHNKLLYNIH
jgi:hypothetical protein